jgi:rubrerythrin
MKEEIKNLLYEALETEIGGVQVYENALENARNADLKKEWKEYHEQTQRHEAILRDVFEKLGLDPDKRTPGREVVGHIGKSLVLAMQMAREKADPGAAELVAAECVVLAETKDHMNWELIGEVAKKLSGDSRKALKEAHDKVEDEEDEHLYHTQGWTRELWMKTLGLPAVLPPPEERKDVKTAIGAARAKQSRRPAAKARKQASKPRRAASGRSSRGTKAARNDRRKRTGTHG